MDGKDYFIEGFEKEASKMKAVKRFFFKPKGKTKARLDRMNKFKADKKWSESMKLDPIQRPAPKNQLVDKTKQTYENVKQKANSPGMQVKKRVGQGLLLGGAGAYGLHKLDQPQRTYYPQRRQG
jgi:hypothetical protein